MSHDRGCCYCGEDRCGRRCPEALAAMQEKRMNVRVTKNAEKPESKEILAEAIVRIGDSMRRLQESGLNHKAIVALIHDQTKIGKKEIETVLGALSRLRGWYCRS